MMCISEVAYIGLMLSMFTAGAILALAWRVRENE
jgi:hypothetical protein